MRFARLVPEAGFEQSTNFPLVDFGVFREFFSGSLGQAQPAVVSDDQGRYAHCSAKTLNPAI